MKEAGLPMGRALADENGQVFFTKDPDYDNPKLNKTALRNTLIQSLENDAVIWDSKFVVLNPHGENNG